MLWNNGGFFPLLSGEISGFCEALEVHLATKNNSFAELLFFPPPNREMLYNVAIFNKMNLRSDSMGLHVEWFRMGLYLIIQVTG